MLKTLMVRTTLLAFAWSVSVSAYAIADSPKQINVPAGDLVSALETLARQADISVVYQAKQLAGIRTGGVTGSLTPQEAVTKLLRGTKLHLRTDPITGAMLIEPPHTNALSTTGEGSATDPKTASNDAGNGDSKRSFWDRFRVAQVDQGTSSGATPVDKQNRQPSKEKPVLLEEVVVTAQKREERLQDVPVPVTAISGAILQDRNQLRLQDYYTSVPGLSVVAGGDNGVSPQISIRGVTTGGSTNPAVGIVVDDVPYGSSTILGGGYDTPDFDPGDLARVEVLRGPQGTLYGASSLGGLIKYVTVDPSTDRTSGRLEAGFNSVHNGAQIGYNVRGSANVPLSDMLAIRVSAFDRSDPGYLDDPALGVKGVNRNRVSGGRLATLWRPSENLSLKLSALYQDSKADGWPFIGSSLVAMSPPLGDLQQVSPAGVGFYRDRLQAYSATLAVKLGHVDLTVISGYNVNQVRNAGDLTSQGLGGLNQFVFHNPAASAAPLESVFDIKKFTQEVRIGTPIGSKVDWILGGFYTHEDSDPAHQTILATNPLTGKVFGTLATAYQTYAYAEYAAFTDITVHFTDQFDVQIGGRESHNDQTYTPKWTGPFVPIIFGVPDPLIPPKADVSGNAFTYLFTPQFKFSPDFMIYGRLASGYRPGGANVNNTVHGLPSFAPDSTENYELGAKGDAFDHKLSFDVSAYYIDWKKIQLQVIDPTTHTALYINGSRAKSEGIELSGDLRPLRGLDISGWFAYNNAALTRDLPPGLPGTAVGLSGDRLPDSSRISAQLSLDQELFLTDRLSALVGGSVSYVGNRKGVFTAPNIRADLPAYTRTDLRAGVKYESWKADLYVNNVTDKRGLTSAAASNPNFFVVIQPRTVGISIAKTF